MWTKACSIAFSHGHSISRNTRVTPNALSTQIISVWDAHASAVANADFVGALPTWVCLQAIQLFGQPYGLQEMIGSWGGGRHRTHSDDFGVRFDRLHHGGIWAPSQQIKKPLACNGCDQGTPAQASGGPRVTALEPSLDEPGGKALESLLRTGVFYS